MSSLIDFALNEEYKRLESAGDKLAEIGSRIDWEPFSSMLGLTHDNRTDSRDIPDDVCLPTGLKVNVDKYSK